MDCHTCRLRSGSALSSNARSGHLYSCRSSEWRVERVGCLLSTAMHSHRMRQKTAGWHFLHFLFDCTQLDIEQKVHFLHFLLDVQLRAVEYSSCVIAAHSRGRAAHSSRSVRFIGFALLTSPPASVAFETAISSLDCASYYRSLQI